MRQQAAVSDATRMRTAFDAEIARVGQTVQVYQPSHIVGADLNLLPSSVSYVGTATAFFQFSQSARDEALAFGIYADAPAYVYFRAADAATLGDRYVLVDAADQAWVIRSLPVQEVLPTAIGTRALVTRLAVRPAGIA